MLSRFRSLLIVATSLFGLAACAAPITGGGFGASGYAPQVQPAGKGSLTVSPAKLDFTTTPKLKIAIAEKGYTGNFILTLSQAGIVKLSAASAKGPGPAKITVIAKAAGKATLTVADATGNKKTVPVTVTQGIIIIQ